MKTIIHVPDIGRYSVPGDTIPMTSITIYTTKINVDSQKNLAGKFDYPITGDQTKVSQQMSLDLGAIDYSLTLDGYIEKDSIIHTGTASTIISGVVTDSSALFRSWGVGTNSTMTIGGVDYVVSSITSETSLTITGYPNPSDTNKGYSVTLPNAVVVMNKLMQYQAYHTPTAPIIYDDSNNVIMSKYGYLSVGIGNITSTSILTDTALSNVPIVHFTDDGIFIDSYVYLSGTNKNKYYKVTSITSSTVLVVAGTPANESSITYYAGPCSYINKLSSTIVPTDENIPTQIQVTIQFIRQVGYGSQ